MISLFKVAMNDIIEDYVIPVLKSGFVTQGSKVEEFENKLKDYFQHPYVLTLNSGTSGLTLALKLLNLDSEDEVITTALTCTATNFPILTNNVKIKWADVDPRTCNINVLDVMNKITEKTKAIMAVHWGGYPVDLEGLKKVQQFCLEKHGFEPPIIEDCAHAFGSQYRGKPIGNHGNISVFSFQAIKHLTCVDGGAILLPTKELYERAKLLRWFGIDREKRSGGGDFRMEEDIPEVGFKYHMNDLNATIGLANLNIVFDNITRNRQVANRYLTELSNLKNVELMKYSKHALSSYWIFTIKVTGKQRFMDFMKSKNIMVSQVHNRNDKHSCMSKFKTELPLLDQLVKSIICIPCGWWLTDSDVDYIINCITEWDNHLSIKKLERTDAVEYFKLLSELNKLPIVKDIDFQQEYGNYIQNNSIYGLFNHENTLLSTGKLIIEEKLGDSVGHLEDIVVNSSYRKKGYGSYIVNYLTNLSKNNGDYKTVLSCSSDNINFYKSCGYNLEGCGMVIRHKYEAII